MKLINVDSSMIHAVGYDARTRTMEVVFNSGRTYCYGEVPQKVYKGLLAAGSKGRYMLDAVIDVFPYHQARGRRRQA
ncbi:MAG: KTSC domain-containing protein [Blastocatellia bacterium]